MNDPIAYFLTWTTYGTWLPGDSRGWTEYHHGLQFPKLSLEITAAASMAEGEIRLSRQQRAAVEQQFHETCTHRRWSLLAVNCRSNHVHVVISAPDTPPKKIRSDLKAWATRRLKQEDADKRKNWWSERGSVRYLYDEDAVEAAIMYATEGQDWKHNKS